MRCVDLAYCCWVFHSEITDEITQLPVLSQSAQLMCHVKPVLTFTAPADLHFQFRMAEKC